MAIPNINDLILYTNKPLDDNDWKTNWNQLISWLTSGTADVTFRTVSGIAVYESTTPPTATGARFWLKTDEPDELQFRILVNGNWRVVQTMLETPDEGAGA